MSDQTKQSRGVKGRRKERRRRRDSSDSEQEAGVTTIAELLRKIQLDSSLPLELFDVGFVNPAEEKPWLECDFECQSGVNLERIVHVTCRKVKVWEPGSNRDFFRSLHSAGPNIQDVLSGFYSFKDEPSFETPQELESDAKAVLPRPTHFLNFRVDDPCVLESVKDVQNHICAMDFRYAPGCSALDSLHVTVCGLGLENAQQVEQTVGVLRRNVDHIRKVVPSDCIVPIRGLETFRLRVLHAKVLAPEALHDFAKYLNDLFASEGVEVRNVYGFDPHMTIFKVVTRLGIAMRSNLIDPSLYIKYKDKDFGSSTVKELQLNSLSDDKSEYVCHFKIRL